MQKVFYSILFFSFSLVMLHSQKISIHKIANGNSIGVLGTQTESQYAQYISKDEFHISEINNINFLVHSYQGNVQFYLNIYKSENGIPGEIFRQIPISVKKNWSIQQVNLDFSNDKISIPDEGLFIGFEWVFNNKNKMKVQNSRAVKRGEDVYFPFISAKLSGNNKLWILKNNVWEKEELNKNNFSDEFAWEIY